MKRETTERYVMAVYLSDLLAVLLSLALAEWLRQALPYGQPLAFGGGVNWGIFLLAAVIWTVVFRQLAAYDPNRILRVPSEVQTAWIAVAVSTLGLAGALYFSYRGLSRLLFGYFALIDALLTVLFRLGLRRLLKALDTPQTQSQRILLAGAGEVGLQMAGVLAERRWMGLEVIGFLDDDPQKLGKTLAGLPVLGNLDETAAIVAHQRIDEVIITLPTYAYRRLEQLVSVLNDMPVNVRVVPDLYPLAYLRATVGVLGDMPLITLKEPVLSGGTLLMKRLLDVTLALLALLLLWPAMLLIALVIKLDSTGPVLFRQQRIGWHGRPFDMYKFRTMVADADRRIDVILDRSENGHRFLRKDKEDPRVTKVGHTLRRWSLDELPQLLNVLKGEMSIVGPRPDLPLLAEDYEPWQRKRFSVPPGITGWWQVTGRSNKPSTLNVEDDLYYIRNYSFLLDLQILMRTIGAVIRGEGAY
jgi:exopolysaccharide biosynthesis polyprenyl glycosylphosphotransferase